MNFEKTPSFKIHHLISNEGKQHTNLLTENDSNSIV